MNNRLDKLLKEWVSQNEADGKHLKYLEKKITEEAVRSRIQADSATEPFPFWQKMSYAACGAVAALIIVALYINLASTQECPNPVDNHAPALADVSRQKIESSRGLFNELDALFSDQLRWVWESNGNIGLGIESLEEGDAEQAQPVLVKLTVLSRSRPRCAWQQSWNTYVMLRGEEMVEIVPDQGPKNKLALWVYPLEEGKLAVDTDISLNIPDTIALSTSTVAEPGKPVSIASFNTSDREYKIYQTVLAL